MKANSNSSFKTLTSPVRIWDLDDGAYRLPAGCVVYYYGAEDTSNSITTSTTGALFITHYSTTYKNWFLFCGNTSTTRYLYNGYSKVDGGASKQFNIGSSYLTGISSYVKNQLDYATSNTTYALSAYQGYVLNQAKQTKIATDLTADIYLVDGTAPTLQPGTYYTNGHDIYVNGTKFGNLSNSIFQLTDYGDGSYSFLKLFGAGYPSAAIYYMWDSVTEEYTTAYSSYLPNTAIDTSMPSNAGYDTRIPSTKLFKSQLGNKENVSNKVTSISSSSTDTEYPSAKLLYDLIESHGIAILTSPIRIWDLEAGVYKIPEGCGIKYKGATSNELIYSPSDSILIVTANEDNNNDVVNKQFFIFGGADNGTNRYIYHGRTSSTTGDWTILTLNNLVSSTAISTIWKGSQNDYDAITTKDANTLYLIEEA